MLSGITMEFKRGIYAWFVRVLKHILSAVIVKLSLVRGEYLSVRHLGKWFSAVGALYPTPSIFRTFHIVEYGLRLRGQYKRVNWRGGRFGLQLNDTGEPLKDFKQGTNLSRFSVWMVLYNIILKMNLREVREL